MKKFDNGTKAVWNVKEEAFPRNGKLESKIKFLIKYAILAPSGHNSQPWKFVLRKNKLEILPDYERKRTAVDPENRELFISLGCAAKNLEIAAEYFGMVHDKNYVIDEKTDKAAIVFDFKDGQKEGKNEKLFEAIVKRQTNRGEFEEEKISKENLLKITQITKDEDINVRIFTDKKDKEVLGKLVYASTKVWFKSRDLVEELDGWLRDDIQGDDGLPTGVLNLYKIAVNLKYFLSKDSPELEEKALKEKANAERAAAIMVVESETDGIMSWIKSGEVFEELILKLASMNLSHGYFNTIVELKTQKEKLIRFCKSKGRPQIVLRVGKSKNKPNFSPRREVTEVLVSSP